MTYWGALHHPYTRKDARNDSLDNILVSFFMKVVGLFIRYAAGINMVRKTDKTDKAKRRPVFKKG